MATEHDHLAQAVRHIARAEEMVMEQRPDRPHGPPRSRHQAGEGHAPYDAEHLGSDARASWNDRTRHRRGAEITIGARASVEGCPVPVPFIQFSREHESRIEPTPPAS